MLGPGQYFGELSVFIGQGIWPRRHDPLAAGALAGIVCAMTIDTGHIHPTINYDDPDPDCALPGISAHAQERPVKVALLNAFGFGSNNAAVVFKKFLR